MSQKLLFRRKPGKDINKRLNAQNTWPRKIDEVLIKPFFVEVSERFLCEDIGYLLSFLGAEPFRLEELVTYRLYFYSMHFQTFWISCCQFCLWRTSSRQLSCAHHWQRWKNYFCTQWFWESQPEHQISEIVEYIRAACPRCSLQLLYKCRSQTLP